VLVALSGLIRHYKAYKPYKALEGGFVLVALSGLIRHDKAL
jgi:hypothetical protein